MAITHLNRRGLSPLETLCTLAALAVGIGVGLVTLRGGWPSLMEAAIGNGAMAEPIASADSTAAFDSTSATEQGVTTPRAELPPPAAAPADSVDNQVQVELTQQLRALRREVALLRDGRGQPERSTTTNTQDASDPLAKSSRDVQIGRRTLAYWNELNTIMEREESMRRVPSGGLTKSNAANFMQRRDKAGRYAVAAFDKLDSAQVDPEAVEMAREIRDWYAQGVELNQQGAKLQRSANKQQRQGAAGQSWGDASKHHNQSVAEINRRGDRLQEKLSERYGLGFPDLR